MKGSRYISFLLCAVMLLTAFVFPLSANAEPSLSGLNKYQQYYLRLIGSYARADYYETDVLASVTVAQAIYEGGWASYSLPIGGNNLFGIKAYSSWSGRVYDQTTSTLYNSYADFLVGLGQIRANETSAWRAHDSWADSVKIHSKLFIESSNYAKVVGEKDYKVALQEIVNGGYCNDNGYVQTAIKILEQYNLDYYDDLTPDDDGIVALVANSERAYLNVGDTHTMTLTYYPNGKTPSSITYESDNTKVAKVDQNGVITAVAHGTAFITATLENGREACCIVYVDTNSTIMDKNVLVYNSPSESSSDKGTMYRGTPVKVTSDKVYTDSNGTEFLHLEGYNKANEYVSGYVLKENIYRRVRTVSEIKLVKNNFTVTPSQKYQIATSIGPIDAIDAKLKWTSSNTSVATVDDAGVVTGVKNGTAVITASASGGAKAEITVTVASKSKNYKGLISVYDSIRVRSEPNWNSGSLGSINFLSEVTVIGEPDGFWYKVTGENNRGKEITGYIFGTYLEIIPDDANLKFATTNSSLSIYENANTDSKRLGAVVSGSQIAIIGDEKNGWNYIVGRNTAGDGIFGFTKLDGSAEIITPPNPEQGGGADVTNGYHGMVTSETELNVRQSNSTSSSIVGQLPSGAKIIITEEENGWYKINYNGLTGYSSAEFIAVLYNAVVVGIEDNLNVRSGPSTNYDVIGKLYNDNKVIAIGAAANNWYKIQKDSLVGYCSADYIKLTGKIYVENNNNTNTDFKITDSSIYIEQGILNGVYEDTKVSELLKAFTGDVSVVDKNGDKLNSDKIVGTGCKIAVTSNGNTTTVATIKVLGDVDGDGNIGTMDYVLIKRAFFGTYKLEGVYLEAGKVTNNDVLSVLDYVLVKRAYFGTYKLK